MTFCLFFLYKAHASISIENGTKNAHFFFFSAASYSHIHKSLSHSWYHRHLYFQISSVFYNPHQHSDMFLSSVSSSPLSLQRDDKTSSSTNTAVLNYHPLARLPQHSPQTPIPSSSPTSLYVYVNGEKCELLEDRRLSLNHYSTSATHIQRKRHYVSLPEGTTLYDPLYSPPRPIPFSSDPAEVGVTAVKLRPLGHYYATLPPGPCGGGNGQLTIQQQHAQMIQNSNPFGDHGKFVFDHGSTTSGSSHNNNYGNRQHSGMTKPEATNTMDLLAFSSNLPMLYAKPQCLTVHGLPEYATAEMLGRYFESVLDKCLVVEADVYCCPSSDEGTHHVHHSTTAAANSSNIAAGIGNGKNTVSVNSNLYHQNGTTEDSMGAEDAHGLRSAGRASGKTTRCNGRGYVMLQNPVHTHRILQQKQFYWDNQTVIYVDSMDWNVPPPPMNCGVPSSTTAVANMNAREGVSMAVPSSLGGPGHIDYHSASGHLPASSGSSAVVGSRQYAGGQNNYNTFNMN